MPRFKVMTYNESGLWDGLEPYIVQARDAKEAAEKVCGARLAPWLGIPGSVRAKVWPLGAKPKLFGEFPDKRA
jgi:hypothetical protein